MDAVLLRRVNRRRARAVSGELADRPPGRQDFLNRQTAEIPRPGFAMVIAETDGLVGGAFGFLVRSDGFWWPGFDGALPRGIVRLTESHGVLAITDILVRPHPRDAHVARRLQERLLSDGHAALDATLVDRFDHPALAALCSWGWLDVGEMLRALVLPVGERTAARPAGRTHGAWARWPG